MENLMDTHLNQVIKVNQGQPHQIMKKTDKMCLLSPNTEDTVYPYDIFEKTVYPL
jgi:hypothetical protein